MLSPDRILDLTPLAAAASDYEVVRRAIGHIRNHWREQPEIESYRRGRRRHPDRIASSVPPLVGAHPEGVPAGAHPRRGAAIAARLGERARRHL